MNNLKTFIFKEYTKGGFPMVGAGICSSHRKNDIIELVASIRNFSIELIDDPFYIDYALASYIGKICSRDIYALGLSIKLPNITQQTGGIIGNPHRTYSSAEGLSEDIGKGLSLAAYPGGPGLVIRGTSKEAETILKTVEPESGGEATLNRLAEKSKELGIDIGIIISDGTGSKSKGFAMTLENDKVKGISIDRGWIGSGWDIK